VRGAELIAAERQRQIEVEGWSPEHDDGHYLDEIALAAAAYALPDSARSYTAGFSAPVEWPWDEDEWKPGPGRERELVKAGALIAAEIDRLQRIGAR
jgi:hypothetical protein